MKAKTGSRLAIHGGDPAITDVPSDLFRWPIVTPEDEAAVLDVLRAGKMSDTDITRRFEREFADWLGVRHALAYCNGTASLHAAMWACGVGAGDEVICPSVTYWASCTAALSLGAAVNFADIDPKTLCIDPADIEHRIGPRTRAIIAVHYCGYPCDMDRILEIARRHGVRVIEDVSHAQGGLYKGRPLGTIGDIAGISLMTGKSLPVGEGGMMVTNDSELYERCVAYGHYTRTGPPDLSGRYGEGDDPLDVKLYAGIPMGGAKHRMNQTCSAMGRVQLRHYPARMEEIQRAMNRFWDLLEGLPGIRAHRPPADSGSTMGGWYNARGLCVGEELGGLSCKRFCEAVRAEGFDTCGPGANFPLHLHRLFHTADLFRQGMPTMIAFGQRDVRQGPGSLPVSESIDRIALAVPGFRRDLPEAIERFATAFRKVIEHADELL